MSDLQNWQLLGALALLVIISWCIARTVRTKAPTADTLRAEQLRDARMRELEWRAQAEHAQAMANMYAVRTARLTGEQA